MGLITRSGHDQVAACGVDTRGRRLPNGPTPTPQPAGVMVQAPFFQALRTLSFL